MRAIRYLLLSALMCLLSPIVFGQSYDQGKAQPRTETGNAPEAERGPKTGNETSSGGSVNDPEPDKAAPRRVEKVQGQSDQGNDPELGSKDRPRAETGNAPKPDRNPKPGNDAPNQDPFNRHKELWALHPGSGYVNGVNYVEAGNYCKSSGGLLASQAQLVTANERGFSFCAYGWLQGGQAGFVMQGTHKGCGRDGWNSAGKPDQNRKFGAYCVGKSAPRNVSSRLKSDISPR
ncbi:MAG: hypothetical protein ACSHXK_10180 [Oceanococcus sp.]